MDAFSERFVNALQLRLPEMIPFVSPDADGESVTLRMPAPSGHGELHVDSQADDEITVRFGPWHGHFKEVYCWWDDDLTPQEQPFERVLTFLKDFLRDLAVIRVWTKGGQVKACGITHEWYPAERSQREADHYYQISWTGRGDLPSVPVDPVEFMKWAKEMATQSKLRQQSLPKSRRPFAQQLWKFLERCSENLAKAMRTPESIDRRDPPATAL